MCVTPHFTNCCLRHVSLGFYFDRNLLSSASSSIPYASFDSLGIFERPYPSHGLSFVLNPVNLPDIRGCLTCPVSGKTSMEYKRWILSSRGSIMRVKHRHRDVCPIYQMESANSLHALLRANGPPKLVSHAERERFDAMCPYVAHHA
jgi:hypothetical protein